MLFSTVRCRAVAGKNLTARARNSDASNETRKKHPYPWIPRDVSIKMQLSLCAIMAS